jgi:1,4-alpha-glucan branching enzyme
VDVLVRDPASTRLVWSRDEGYPGGPAYLEFHKLRFPGGLQLWAVTGARVSLGEKRPYDPGRAWAMAHDHAEHFAGVLDDIARAEGDAESGVIVAPFDAELFGHWWFEGPVFLAEVYRALERRSDVRPVGASEHVRNRGAATALHVPAGSWGRDGDFSVWLNERTAWMWKRLWSIEERFWAVASAALAPGPAQPVLAQAARELLLAQASDWPFIVTTGEVADYGERRFRQHAEAAESLVAALERGGDLDGAAERANQLRRHDSLFPDVLDAVALALGRRPAPV